MNARDVLASVTGYCDACGAGPGVVCDPFCLGVADLQDLQDAQDGPDCGDPGPDCVEHDGACD